MIYTNEHDEWLRENVRGSHWRTVTEQFNKRFKEDKTWYALRKYCNRVGIYVTEPLGKKTCWNQKDYGNEIKCGNGYKRIKTPEGYRLKHVVIWENHHGEVPKGFNVVFLDGDNTNYDINNLFIASRRAIQAKRIFIRHEPHFRTKDPDLNKVIWTWMELYLENRILEEEQ